MLDRTSHHLPLLRGPLHLGVAVVLALAAAPGCSSDDTPPAAGTCSDGGGPLPGMATDTCMGMFQSVGMCMHGTEDGGGGDIDAGPPQPLPDPSIGTSNNDDDCKYKVSFTNDCLQQGAPGTIFTVTLTSLTDNMKPVSGSTQTYIEAFLNDHHPADTGGNAAETPAGSGVYKFPPVKFDASGKWTVRFHFFGDCSDMPMDSPHAHAAFFVNVP